MISSRRLVFVFSAVLLAIAMVACGSSSGTPTAVPVSDPNEIITRSANGMAAVQTVHFDVAISGSLKAQALGSSGSGLGLTGPIRLDGATVSGDVDVQKRAFHLTASMPTLMGLSADLILVDGYQYTKNSLAGDKYTKSKASMLLPLASSAPGATLDISGTVNSLKSSLDAAGVRATLVGREKANGRDAYRLSVIIPKDLINQQVGALSGDAAGSISIDTVTLDYWVYVDSLYPAKMVLKANSATAGNLTFTVTLTKYNEPVAVKVPADSEIEATQ